MNKSIGDNFPIVLNNISIGFKKYPIENVLNLPKYSNWPQRLLDDGMEATYNKTSSSIFSEYEDHKWGDLLKTLRSNKGMSVNSMRKKFFGNNVLPAKWLDSYYLLNGYEYSKLQSKLISLVLKHYAPDTVIDLGAGFDLLYSRLQKLVIFVVLNFMLEN